MRRRAMLVQKGNYVLSILPDHSSLIAFVVASLVLAIRPGPSVFIGLGVFTAASGSRHSK